MIEDVAAKDRLRQKAEESKRVTEVSLYLLQQNNLIGIK